MSLRLVSDLVASLALDKEEVNLLEAIFICRAGEHFPHWILTSLPLLSSTCAWPRFWTDLSHLGLGKALACTVAKPTWKASSPCWLWQELFTLLRQNIKNH